MIKFEKLEFKNFMSYGNKPTVWNFESGKISRISGKNGMGKSSVIESMYFAIFGKTFRKQKLNQLVNWINKKDTVVKLWFSVQGKKYLIERGLVPNYLKVYEVDESGQENLIPISSSKLTYQNIIEEEIIKMNEGVFNQTVIKSMSKNISFMNLSKYEKRQIVESILGIEVFSHMNNNAKQKIQDTKYQIELILEKIKSSKILYENELSNLTVLKNMKKKIENDSKIKINELHSELEKQQSLLNEHTLALKKLLKYDKKLNEYEKSLSEIKKERTLKRKIKNKLEASIILGEQKIELFSSTCPGCPKLDEIKNDISLGDQNKKLNSVNKELHDQQENILSIEKDIAKVKKILTNESFINNTIKNTKSRIKGIDSEIKKASKEKEVVQIDESKLKSISKSRKELDCEYNELSKTNKHLNVLKTLLADEGIKSFIIKRYLPHINKILNTYLQKFDTNILFYFDTEFNDVIGSRYKEKSNYGCFSEGQKRRIDLSVLFTFIDFSQIKNRKSNTNLMILDEITAGVDLEGENTLFDILKDIASKEDKEIITVSQSTSIDPEKIDRLFEVSSESGFSKLELVNT